MKKFNLNCLGAIVASLLLVVTSCSKKDDPKSRTDLLTAKSWTMTKMELLVGGSYQDISSYAIEDCTKDDIITFSKSHAYKLDAGADDCDGDSPSLNGTWAFKDGDKTLSVTVASISEDSQIESLSDKTFVVKKPLDVSGTTIDSRITFTGK